MTLILNVGWYVGEASSYDVNIASAIEISAFSGLSLHTLYCFYEIASVFIVKGYAKGQAFVRHFAPLGSG